jgi:hypothetical protein
VQCVSLEGPLRPLLCPEISIEVLHTREDTGESLSFKDQINPEFCSPFEAKSRLQVSSSGLFLQVGLNWLLPHPCILEDVDLHFGPRPDRPLASSAPSNLSSSAGGPYTPVFRATSEGGGVSASSGPVRLEKLDVTEAVIQRMVRGQVLGKAQATSLVWALRLGTSDDDGNRSERSCDSAGMGLGSAVAAALPTVGMFVSNRRFLAHVVILYALASQPAKRHSFSYSLSIELPDCWFASQVVLPDSAADKPCVVGQPVQITVAMRPHCGFCSTLSPGTRCAAHSRAVAYVDRPRIHYEGQQPPQQQQDVGDEGEIIQYTMVVDPADWLPSGQVSGNFRMPPIGEAHKATLHLFPMRAGLLPLPTVAIGARCKGSDRLLVVHVANLSVRQHAQVFPASHTSNLARVVVSNFFA